MKPALIILCSILLFSCTKNNVKPNSINYGIYNGTYDGYIYSEKIETVFSPNFSIDTALDTTFVSYQVALNSKTIEIITTNEKYATGIVDSSILKDSIICYISSSNKGHHIVGINTKDSILFKDYAYYGQGSGFYSYKFKYALKKQP
jgi:hypothetical protein